MVSIIICTRNRVEVLKQCLECLLKFDTGENDREILVVDNNSTDDTAVVVKELAANHAYVRYILETNIGLSAARNTGMRNARYPYLAYIDDDGKVRANYLTHIAKTITGFQFDCFGGWYQAWYRTTKPKWVPESFGNSVKWRNETGILNNNEYIPGCIFIIRKEALIDCGGFPLNLGMKGNEIRYGEEYYVQKILRDKGYSIGFCPDLILDHLVQEERQKLSWHLRAKFALGRDNILLKDRVTFSHILLGFAKGVLYPLPLLLYHLPKLFTQKEFYWQNWILKSFDYPLRQLGASYRMAFLSTHAIFD